MENKPICKSCRYMSLERRAKVTGNNDYKKGPRGECVCTHPRAEESFQDVCPKSPRLPGFIGFTKPGEATPNIRTSPRWCPLRQGPDILPCPCGAKPVLVRAASSRWFVDCPRLDCEFTNSRTLVAVQSELEAAEIWNKEVLAYAKGKSNNPGKRR